MSHYDPWLFGACHLVFTLFSLSDSRSSCQQKLLAECVVWVPFLFPPYYALASRLPLFGVFPWRFTLWVREQSWTELRWGMALSDHHYTSPPFHLHLIILISPWGRVRACVFVYSVISCFALSVYVREGKSERRQRNRKMKRREKRKRSVHMIQPLHLMRVPFAPYCLSHCWKKAGDLPSLKRQLIPFPLAWFFVCLCGSVYGCANVCSTFIQTTIAFACVQWPICRYELWQYLPKQNSFLMAAYQHGCCMGMDVQMWNLTVCLCVFPSQLTHRRPGHRVDGESDPENEPPCCRSHPALVCTNTNIPHCYK